MTEKIKELENKISDAKIFGNMAKVAKLEEEIKALKDNSKSVADRVQLSNAQANREREVEREAAMVKAREMSQLRQKQFEAAFALKEKNKELKRVRKELDKMVEKQERWVNSSSWHLGTTGTERLEDILPIIVAELESMLESREDIQFCKFFAHCWEKFASNPYYQYWQMVGERSGWDYTGGTVDLNGALNDIFVPAGRVLEAGKLRFFKKA